MKFECIEDDLKSVLHFLELAKIEVEFSLKKMDTDECLSHRIGVMNYDLQQAAAYSAKLAIVTDAVR